MVSLVSLYSRIKSLLRQSLAGLLPAKYVIHAVGPVWQDGQHDEAQAYDRCLGLAAAHGLTSLAFPNISTGVYRFPKPAAAKIAFAAMQDNLARYSVIKSVLAVCFDEENLALYQRLLEGVGDETK